MEPIKEALVQGWWYFQNSDDAVLIGLLTVAATGTAVSYVTQHFKRKYNIDLWKYGKLTIYAIVTLGSMLGALADFFILNSATHPALWIGGLTPVLYQFATIIHAVHVSKGYAKLVRVLNGFQQNVASVKAAKYSKPVSQVPTVFTDPDTTPAGTGRPRPTLSDR